MWQIILAVTALILLIVLLFYGSMSISAMEDSINEEELVCPWCGSILNRTSEKIGPEASAHIYHDECLNVSCEYARTLQLPTSLLYPQIHEKL